MDSTMSTAVSFDQFCPVAVSLDALHNRWSVLLLRDMLWAGPQSRQGLIERNPGLSDSELDEAIERLRSHGLVHQLDEPKARFSLTERGEGISDVISALFNFGLPLIGEVTATTAMLEYALADCSRRRRLDLLEVEQRAIVRMKVDEADVCVELSPGLLQAIEHDAPQATITLPGRFLAALIGGSVTPDELRTDGTLTIEGDPAAADQLLALLPAIH